MHRVHIAVLETDIPSPAVYAKRGLYNTQFRKLLSAAADRLNRNSQNLKHGPIDIRVTAFDVVGGSFPDLQDLRAEWTTPNGICPVDAILVTGAVAAAYDDIHWIPALESFIQTVHIKYPLVKIFGSCFGHQLIGQALLEKSGFSYIREWPTKFSVQAQSSHEIGLQSITLNPDFACRFSSLASFKQMEPFKIQLIHGDVVAPTTTPSTERDSMNAFLPAPWINVGSSETCLIQGLYYPGRVLTLQGHFEYDAFAAAELCLHFSKKFSWPSDLLSSHLDAIWRGNRAENDDGDDSKVATEAVLLFFAGED